MNFDFKLTVYYTYRIQIQPDFQNSTTHGMEMITLHVAEDTSSIIFHVNRIDINKDSVIVKKTENSNGKSSTSVLSLPEASGTILRVSETFK